MIQEKKGNRTNFHQPGFILNQEVQNDDKDAAFPFSQAASLTVTGNLR